MPQTAINYRQPQFLNEGQYYTTSPRRIDGAVVPFPNGQGAVLPFGRVCHLVAGKAVLPSQAADATHQILGVSILNERYGLTVPTLVGDPTTVEEGYPNDPNALVECMTMGDIVMFSEEALVPGDSIAYRFDTASLAGSKLGRVRKYFSGAAAGAQVGCETLPNAKALTACSANSLVVIRVGTFTASGTNSFV